MKPRPWTKPDVKSLRRLARAGWTSRRVAKWLRRGPGAVRFKAMTLRIRFMSRGRRFSDAQRRRYK